MSSIRYTEEFKIEAIKQVTDRGFTIREVVDRLGITPTSLSAWIKKYGQGTERAYQGEAVDQLDFGPDLGRAWGPSVQPRTIPACRNSPDPARRA